MGLLPEVYCRRLFERKGFSSIFEFAAKLAGVSEEQVRLVLNLDKRFRDKPVLREMLIKGEASVHKLARIVSISTVENQGEISRLVKCLPQKSLEILVRDTKNEDGFMEPQNEYKSLRAQTPPQAEKLHTFLTAISEHSLGLSVEVIGRLWELKHKGFDLNRLILDLLAKREAFIAAEKEKWAEDEFLRVRTNNSRHIPVPVIKILKEEYGDKCSIPGCRKIAEQFHHTRRFMLSRSHHPRYLAPLCYGHHRLAHWADLEATNVAISMAQR